MTESNQPLAELLFGPADATPISTDPTTVKDWAEALEAFAAAPKYWLATGRADGDPHVMPVLGVWLDEAFYISTRPTSLKGKHLAHTTRCVVTVSTSTIDLVVECDAVEVAGDQDLQRIVEAFDSKYEWRLTVRDGHAHEDNLPGSPVYGVWQLTPRVGFGFGPDGMTATRWRF